MEYWSVEKDLNPLSITPALQHSITPNPLNYLIMELPGRITFSWAIAPPKKKGIPFPARDAFLLDRIIYLSYGNIYCRRTFLTFLYVKGNSVAFIKRFEPG